MSKRALLIGINYFNTPSAQLYGCIFDIIQMKSLLIDVYGFSEKDIIMLRDDDPSNMPTKQRIVNECAALVAARPTYAFLHYSGHGTSIKDTNGDEKDGQDECIVPCDFQTAGIIADDDLNKILKNIQSNGIALFDCCRSGTILDLPNEQVNKSITTPTTNGLFCFSGCQDPQTSAETFAVASGLPQGAATAAFISVLRRLKYYPTISQLYDELKNELKANGFEQIPNLTSNVQLTAGNQFPILRNESQSFSAIQILNLQAELQKATAQNTANLAIIGNLQLQLSDSKMKLASTQGQLASTQAQLASAQSQLASTKSQLASAQSQLAPLQSQLASVQSQLASTQGQLTSAQSQLTASKNQLAPLQSQLSTYIVRVASVNGLNESLKQQITTLQQQIAKLTAKK